MHIHVLMIKGWGNMELNWSLMHQSFETPTPHPGQVGGKQIMFPWEACSLSLLRPTCWGMSREFRFDLSVVAFSGGLVIWTFNMNYFCKSWPCSLRLEMLFKVWWGDFKKGCHSRFYTHRTLVCTAECQGAGTSLSIFAPVSKNFTGFHSHTEWMSPPCLGWGFKWVVH